MTRGALYLVSGFHRAIKSIKYRRLDSQFWGTLWAIPIEYAKDILPWMDLAFADADISQMSTGAGGKTYNQPLGCDLTPTLNYSAWREPVLILRANRMQVVRAMNALGIPDMRGRFKDSNV